MKDAKTKVLMMIAYVCWGISALLTVAITAGQKSLLKTFYWQYESMNTKSVIPVTMLINLAEAILLYSIFAAVSANGNGKSRKMVSIIFLVVKCVCLLAVGLLGRFVTIWQYSRMTSTGMVATVSNLESMISAVARPVLTLANMIFFTALGAYMGSEQANEQ